MEQHIAANRMHRVPAIALALHFFGADARIVAGSFATLAPHLWPTHWSLLMR
jgi:hypothetical protein